jgi:hypothetical protein
MLLGSYRWRSEEGDAKLKVEACRTDKIKKFAFV